jgi:AcrR family transcriptional regulator
MTETRRDLQKRETREAIQRAARALFDEKGFEGTTVRAIASGAGVGVGTVHLHFKDKESLLLECLIDDIAENDRRSWESLPRGVGLREQLLHLAREGFRGWTRRPALSRVLLRQMIFSRAPALNRLRDIDQQVMDRISGLLTRARERGEIRAGVDPALATRAIFSFYFTSVLEWLGEEAWGVEGQDSRGGPALSEEALEGRVEEAGRLVDMILEGIGAGKGYRG